MAGRAAGYAGLVTSSHDEHVRREFSRQAASFEDPSYSFGDRRLMAWILEHVPVAPDAIVLDVAAGTGHMARGYAPHARQVVAIDLTPEMLSVGKAQVDASDIPNVLFERGDAASLPYLDGSFDLVVSRFAVHHFDHPGEQLGEMVRVCRSGGRVGLIDLVVADGQPADVLNEVERRRDPSHTEALSLGRLTGLIEAAGGGSNTLSITIRPSMPSAGLLRQNRAARRPMRSGISCAPTSTEGPRPECGRS